MTVEHLGEKRQYPRTDLAMAVNLRADGMKMYGRVIDVSARGAKLATRKPLTVGQQVKMELYLCESDPFPIRLVGQCRWAKRNEESETVAGFDLSESHERNLNVLERFLQQIAN